MQNRTLKNTLKRKGLTMENEGNAKKRRPKKNKKRYEELKQRKRKIENAFKDITNTLHKEITEVNVKLKFDSGKTMSFFQRQPTEADACLKCVQEEEENKEPVQKFMAIKEKYRISDEAFHELHMIGKVIP